MTNKIVDGDSLFKKLRLRYESTQFKRKPLVPSELRDWPSHDLSAILEKVDGLDSITHTFERKYPWGPQAWIKPLVELIERAAEEDLALCINNDRS